MRQKCAKRNHSFWIPATKVRAVTLKPKRAMTTFQQALRATIIVGQIFSLLPVDGILSNDANNVKFVKTSWRCLYAVLSIIGQTFLIVLYLSKIAYSTVTLNSVALVIFYATACITMVMFLQAARHWPQLVQHISKFEEINPCYDNNLYRKCAITCSVIIILAMSEHMLSILFTLTCFTKYSIHNISYNDFVTYLFPWIFNCIPYTPFTGVTIQFLHIQATFVWNFSDIFVICISYYLTSRLRQVNEKVLSAQGKYLPEIFWRTAREDYCRTTQIVHKVDDVISGIVFVSFANNLFFVCKQLFNIIGDVLSGNGKGCGGNVTESALLGGYESSVYYMFSLIYLLLRSIAVSLIASEVNTVSIVPARVLYSVPSPVYCVEVQRFLDHVKGEKVGLSGLQFFLVTRGLILTVAGTIITYELVMVQFTSPAVLSNSTVSIH